jgi:hypothetical protein
MKVIQNGPKVIQNRGKVIQIRGKVIRIRAETRRPATHGSRPSSGMVSDEQHEHGHEHHADDNSASVLETADKAEFAHEHAKSKAQQQKNDDRQQSVSP